MCPYRHHCFEKVDPRETEEINYVSRLYEILGMLVWHEMKGNLILELAHLGILIRKKRLHATKRKRSLSFRYKCRINVDFQSGIYV